MAGLNVLTEILQADLECPSMADVAAQPLWEDLLPTISPGIAYKCLFDRKAATRRPPKDMFIPP